MGAGDGDGVDAIGECCVSISDSVIYGFVYDSGNTTVVIGGAVFWSCVVKVVVGVVVVKVCLLGWCKNAHFCKT